MLYVWLSPKTFKFPAFNLVVSFCSFLPSFFSPKKILYVHGEYFVRIPSFNIQFSFLSSFVFTLLSFRRKKCSESWDRLSSFRDLSFPEFIVLYFSVFIVLPYFLSKNKCMEEFLRDLVYGMIVSHEIVNLIQKDFRVSHHSIANQTCSLFFTRLFSPKTMPKGTVSWDRYQKCWQQFTELSLSKGASGF